MPGKDSNSPGGAVLILILRDCSWFDGAGNSRDAGDGGKFARARRTQAGVERIKAKNSARDIPGHLLIMLDTNDESKLSRSEILIVGEALIDQTLHRIDMF
jgi:hypothetical protein